MSPQVERPEPPYVQVVRALRARIESGELRDGDMLPSVRKISEEWSIAHATATKVMAALRSEGLARGVPGIGTVVVAAGAMRSPQQRIAAIKKTGKIYPPNERARIISAEVMEAPAQVADALGLEEGARVIRRHRVTYRDDKAVSASTSFFDGSLAEVAPHLLVLERLTQGTPGYIAEKTGREITHGRDQYWADGATERDAAELEVAESSPVQRGCNWVYDAEGAVIEYGEYVAAPGRRSSYDYEITN
jgi:DNA-binding GntR family transcriptional regulator